MCKKALISMQIVMEHELLYGFSSVGRKHFFFLYNLIKFSLNLVISQNLNLKVLKGSS
jgi:hypothetical protein